MFVELVDEQNDHVAYVYFMAFPRGGIYSTTTEPGNTIILTQPINLFDS
jgi:hypothetical protein